MFKNITTFKFENEFALSAEELNELLKNKPLLPCLTQEMESIGWVPSNGDKYAEQVNNAIFIKIGVEEKKLTSAMIKTAVDQYILDNDLSINSKSELKELREHVLNLLIPNIPAQRSFISAAIDLDNSWLIVDASSSRKASLLTSYLRKTIGSLPIIPFRPNHSVTSIMTHWVLNGINSEQLSLNEDVELKELKDEGGFVKVKGVPLTSSDVQSPLRAGWQVKQVSLNFDDRVNFHISNDFIFKRIKLSEKFYESIDIDDDRELQQQAERYLFIDVVRKLIDSTLRASR